jgi:hypothetical protein
MASRASHRGHGHHGWNLALATLTAVVLGACVVVGVLTVLATRARSGLPCEGRAALAALAAGAVGTATATFAPNTTAHLLRAVAAATGATGTPNGALHLRVATWCPFACVLVAADTPAQRQAVFEALVGEGASGTSTASGTFERAGKAPFTARLTGVPYDNLVYVVLKKPSTDGDAADADADPDDPTPALPVAEVLTPARARALRALDVVFGANSSTTHYVTPKRKN